MLGNLLDRQAEEEERRRRLSEHQSLDGHNVGNEAAESLMLPVTSLTTSPRPYREGSLSNLSNLSNLSSSPAVNAVNAVNNEGGGFLVYEEDNDGEHYSYNADDDGDEYDGVIEDVVDDLDADNADEGSYLLSSSSQRRLGRKRRLSNDDEDDDEEDEGGQRQPWQAAFRKSLKRLGRKIHGAVMAIADVDGVFDGDSREFAEMSAEDGASLYDSLRDPVMSARSRVYHALMGEGRSRQSHYGHYHGHYDNSGHSDRRGHYQRQCRSRCNNRTAALFWFSVLAMSYATERMTFKLIVDRFGPFRLFSAELLLSTHASLLGIICLGTACFCWKDKKGKDKLLDGEVSPWALPLVDIGLMAILDTVYLLLGVISGSHVPPVLTVIFVQAIIPLTACFTQFIHPDGRCTRLASSSSSASSSSPSTSPTANTATNDNSNNFLSASSTSQINLRSPSNAQLLSRSSPRPQILTRTPTRTPTLTQSPTPALTNAINGANHANATTMDTSATTTSTPLHIMPVKGWGGLSQFHIIGTILISVAILIGMTPATLTLYASLNAIPSVTTTTTTAVTTATTTAYNTIIFCLASIPAAIGQLYKEHTLTKMRQPVNRDQLNLMLSSFQLLFTIAICPLVYGLQGLGYNTNTSISMDDGTYNTATNTVTNSTSWMTLYPSQQIGDNFSHAMQCFLGTLDEDIALHGYPEQAHCSYSHLLLLLHAASIIMVGLSIDKLAVSTTKLMYRGVSMGTILAISFMFAYQRMSPKDERYYWEGEYDGTVMNGIYLTSAIVLILGAEIYHRVSFVDATFETVYPDIADLYDEDE